MIQITRTITLSFHKPKDRLHMRQVPHEEDIHQLYIASPPLTQRTRLSGRILLFPDPGITAPYGFGDIRLGMDDKKSF